MQQKLTCHSTVRQKVSKLAVGAQQCGWIRALREVKVSKIIITGFQYYYGTEKYGFWIILIIFGPEGCSTKKYDFTLLFICFGQSLQIDHFAVVFDTFWIHQSISSEKLPEVSVSKIITEV